MCWEAIDDHLLWTKVLYDFSLFLFACFFCWFDLVLVDFCHPFCWPLILLFFSHVFSLLVVMVEVVWRVMHCIYWLQTNAQICTDNFKLFQNMSNNVVCYLWFTNSVWYIKGWVWQPYRPQFSTKILANYMWNSICVTKKLFVSKYCVYTRHCIITYWTSRSEAFKLFNDTKDP